MFILGSDTGGAIVQMADTKVFATQRDHWPGTKTKTVSTENCTLDYVKARLKTAIHLQTNPITQTVFNQCMVRLGQAGFPG